MKIATVQADVRRHAGNFYGDACGGPECVGDVAPGRLNVRLVAMALSGALVVLSFGVTTAAWATPSALVLPPVTAYAEADADYVPLDEISQDQNVSVPPGSLPLSLASATQPPPLDVNPGGATATVSVVGGLDPSNHRNGHSFRWM